jgi:hypothetical protein
MAAGWVIRVRISTTVFLFSKYPDCPRGHQRIFCRGVKLTSHLHLGSLHTPSWPEQGLLYIFIQQTVLSLHFSGKQSLVVLGKSKQFHEAGSLFRHQLPISTARKTRPAGRPPETQINVFSNLTNTSNRLLLTRGRPFAFHTQPSSLTSLATIGFFYGITKVACSYFL